ncbi:MAG: hypothetical protein K0Q59_989 [Paenibacillus sp.]|jgi:sensor histidine kinase regulating citrate/malate metabolism|nr:hypothetical protein [Paenibacillus sp.]
MERVTSRSAEERADGSYGEQQQLFMQTINHLRHDWMNDIQVLYGYLKLKKYDKMHDYMDMVKDKMAKENGISRLGIPDLVVYVQSFRVRCRSIRLEVELESGLQLTVLPIDQEALSDAIIGVLESFVKHSGMAADGEPNHLVLKTSLKEQCLIVGFEYSGCYERSGLQRDIHNVLRSSGVEQRIDGEAAYDENEAVIGFHVPLEG